MNDEVDPIRFFQISKSLQQRVQFEDPEFDLQWFQIPKSIALPPNATHFGFVFDGEVKLTSGGRSFPLGRGMYFTAVGETRLSGCGEVVVVSQVGYVGIFSLGGPVENSGRLHYIDGCSDTLLVSPVVKGDACLNFLKLPERTDQTFHTHPSFRFGIIFSGAGRCDIPGGSEPLSPGTIFYIPPNGQHRFRTQTQSLSVIAFHPDSDFGPEDDNHPMVNKTIVEGVSAARLSRQQRGVPQNGIHEKAAQ